MPPHQPKGKRYERRLERDLIKLVIFVLILIGIYFAASAVFKARNSFDYQGLKFTKEKYGELPVYHYYYYFKGEGGRPIQYNLYLQHDPRTNNVSVTGDPVVFKNKYLYLTLDTSYPSTCRDNAAGLVDLRSFLSDNTFTIITGIMNESYALEHAMRYITCGTQSDSSEVIQVYGGNETQIIVDNNCHSIIIGPDCRIREAVEKFKILSVIEARTRNRRGVF